MADSLPSQTAKVQVVNLPATQPVSGSVTVTNFPATQPISGTVTANAGSGTLAISSAQLPSALDGSGYLKMHEQGTVPVTGTFWQATQPISGAVSVSNLPGTQPISGTVTANAGTGTMAVSAASLPLPAGASTEATLALIKAKTDNLDVALSTRTKPGDTQPVSGTFWQATQPISGTVTANAGSGTMAVSGAFFQATQPVSAAALPLPSGASTEATLALIKAKTDNLDVLLSTRTKPSDTQPVSGTFWQATQPVSGTVTVTSLPSGSNTIGKVDQGAAGASGWKVDGSAVTQPVSGVFFQATQPVSAASLPLPTGASTEATLALIKAKTDNLDVLLSTRTKPADTQPVSGTFWQATQPVSGVFYQATQPVSAASLPLPTNATAEAGGNLGFIPLLLTQILNELQITNMLLKEGFLIKDEVESLRLGLSLENLPQ